MLRREILRTLAGSAPCFFLDAKLGLSQTDDDAESLKIGVMQLAEHVGGQTAEVQEWLQNSEVVRSENRRSFHGSFSNKYELVSGEPLEFETPFKISSGTGLVGVDRHPWMAASRHAKLADLNLAEIAALSPAAHFIGNQIYFYSGGGIVPIACPFPLGPRNVPQVYHRQAFGALVAQSGGDPRYFPLLYYRRFIMGFRNQVTGRSFPAQVIGHGYQTPDGRLLVSYNLIPA